MGIIFSENVESIDWEYEEGAVFTQTVRGLQPIENRKSIYRSDTGDVMSVVGSGYHPVQPTEMLDFFQSISDKYGFKLINFRSLAGGKKLVATADMGEAISLLGDEHRNYLNFYTAVDGTSATKVMCSSVRMACTNQLRALSSEANDSGYMHYLRHSRRFDAAAVELDLGLVYLSFQEHYEKVRSMAKTKVSHADSVNFFKELLGLDTVPDRYSHRFYQLLGNAYESPGSELDSSKDTLYGLVNAVSYYTDHQTKPRGVSGNVVELRRADSSLFTGGAQLKKRAFDLAYEWAA